MLKKQLNNAGQGHTPGRSVPLGERRLGQAREPLVQVRLLSCDYVGAQTKTLFSGNYM